MGLRRILEMERARITVFDTTLRDGGAVAGLQP